MTSIHGPLCLADVEAHPEHRKFVFPDRPEDAKAEEASDNTPGLYDKNGRLKHPERSLYYDPVYNPYGAPPPGMPYREKRQSCWFIVLPVAQLSLVIAQPNLRWRDWACRAQQSWPLSSPSSMRQRRTVRSDLASAISQMLTSTSLYRYRVGR